MINTHDTYSEKMTDKCIVPLNIRNVSNFKIWERFFWLESFKNSRKGTLSLIYVLSRHRTIILIKYEKNLITIYFFVF